MVACAPTPPILPRVLTRWLFLVFGESDEHYAQAHLAALTLLAHAPEPRELLLATDHPARFAWLARAPGVRVAALEPAQLTAWKGAHGFFWRIKLMAIRAHLPDDGALVYLDSDTFARSPLGPLVARLASGARLMHERERPLAESRRRGDRTLWAACRGRDFGGVRVAEDAAMWNAGVVGVGPDGGPAIDRAIAACDAFCAAFGNHNLNEQFALSLALAEGGRLEPASPWIDHYWGNKPDHARAIGAQLGRILGDGLDPLAAAAWVAANPIRLPLHVRRPWWKKALARRLGVG